jgi:hypothetical protein
MDLGQEIRRIQVTPPHPNTTIKVDNAKIVKADFNSDKPIITETVKIGNHSVTRTPVDWKNFGFTKN